MPMLFREWINSKNQMNFCNFCSWHHELICIYAGQRSVCTLSVHLHSEHIVVKLVKAAITKGQQLQSLHIELQLMDSQYTQATQTIDNSSCVDVFRIVTSSVSSHQQAYLVGYFCTLILILWLNFCVQEARRKGRQEASKKASNLLGQHTMKVLEAHALTEFTGAPRYVHCMS